MTIELRFLVACVVLGFVHLIAASHLISWQRGYRWTASSREETVTPLRGLANRVDQATINFLETFPFFVALVLIAHVTNHHSLLALWGVQLYFLGSRGLLAHCLAWFRSRAVGHLLEYRICWHGTNFYRTFLIDFFKRLTNRWPL